MTGLLLMISGREGRLAPARRKISVLEDPPSKDGLKVQGCPTIHGESTPPPLAGNSRDTCDRDDITSLEALSGSDRREF
jgi:hypothetical protein